MNTDQQRLVISTLCGWKIHKSETWPKRRPKRFEYILKSPSDIQVLPQFCVGPELVSIEVDRVIGLQRTPNYPADLNAMHEAEKVLTEKQQVWYLQKLTQVRFKNGVAGMIACMNDKTTFATAAERAEAFLRTLNLWREE